MGTSGQNRYNRFFRSLPEPYARNKYPLRHKWTVSDCAAISVHDRIALGQRSGIRTATVRVGWCDRTFLVCPVCNRRYEHLFLTPDNGEEWLCRKCAGIIYASQRHKSPRNPHRAIPTPRKRRFDRSDGLPWGFTVPRIPKNADLDAVAAQGALELLNYVANMRRNGAGMPILTPYDGFFTPC
jgi:hypothetical protein